MPLIPSLVCSFVTVHVGKEEAAKWKEQGHGYVPQTYFFSPEGTALDIKGPMEKYAHYFSSAGALLTAMESAIALTKPAEKNHASGEL